MGQVDVQDDAALSGHLVEHVRQAGINTLIDALIDGGELRIDALGRLWVEERAARQVVSFRLYALDTRLDLPPGATKAEVLEVMQGHIMGQAELMGRYART